jgi:hypothetical protein
MAKNTALTREKMLSRRVLVEIDRDMTAKTSKVVWQHEVPVIEAIYGEGKVKELDPSTMDEGYVSRVSPDLLPWNKKQERIPKPSEAAGVGFVFIGNAHVEYERLASAYGRMSDENVLAVEKVYGRFQSGNFASMVAGADLEDLPEGQLRTLISAYGMEPTGGHKDMTDDDRKAAAVEREAYVALDKAALIKLATEAGVQLG